jgi:serine/threonine-protein kinase HipA
MAHVRIVSVSIDGSEVGTLAKNDDLFYFTYALLARSSVPVSLTMMPRPASWVWGDGLHPIFEMNLPEGYLFELFKTLLLKQYTLLMICFCWNFLRPESKAG